MGSLLSSAPASSTDECGVLYRKALAALISAVRLDCELAAAVGLEASFMSCAPFFDMVFLRTLGTQGDDV